MPSGRMAEGILTGRSLIGVPCCHHRSPNARDRWHPHLGWRRFIETLATRQGSCLQNCKHKPRSATADPSTHHPQTERRLGPLSPPRFAQDDRSISGTDDRSIDGMAFRDGPLGPESTDPMRRKERLPHRRWSAPPQVVCPTAGGLPHRRWLARPRVVSGLETPPA
jgi:hypothetical protein